MFLVDITYVFSKHRLAIHALKTLCPLYYNHHLLSVGLWCLDKVLSYTRVRKVRHILDSKGSKSTGNIDKPIYVKGYMTWEMESWKLRNLV